MVNQLFLRSNSRRLASLLRECLFHKSLVGSLPRLCQASLAGRIGAAAIEGVPYV